MKTLKFKLMMITFKAFCTMGQVICKATSP